MRELQACGPRRRGLTVVIADERLQLASECDCRGDVQGVQRAQPVVAETAGRDQEPAIDRDEKKRAQDTIGLDEQVLKRGRTRLFPKAADSTSNLGYRQLTACDFG